MGIIVDLFAGGGGASHGIYMATGRHPDVAVNHDPVAVAVHARNHPETKHFCQDVWTVHPAWASRGRSVDLLWASPDCTHHSKAKGGAPIRDKQRRDLAMVIADKWVTALKPRIVILENVEEFKGWGPLTPEGRIIEEAKGQHFDEFINCFERQGYKVEYRELRACDYGAPTTRNRFYMIARCDGRPIVWPQPTHGAPGSTEVRAGIRKPWRTAAECIDFSLPCPSIFATSKEIKEQYGIIARRPLKEATMRRIFRGLKKYVLDNPKPFIITNTTGHGPGSIQSPPSTVTTGGQQALVNPYLASYYGDKEGSGFRGRGIDDPLPTQTTENRFSLQMPYIQHVQHGGKKNENRTGAMPASDPLRTITAAPKGGGMALVAPIITSPAHSTSTGRAEYIYDPEDPLRTVCTTPTHAVASAMLVRDFGCSTGSDPNAPAPTIMATGAGKTKLVTANMVTFYGKSDGASVDDPTLTATTKERHGLVTSHIAKMRGTNDGQGQDTPLHTVTAGGFHFAEVRAFLTKYFGTTTGHELDRPLDTVTTKHRYGIVTVHGEDYYIADIGMRMLQPRELLLANGFPEEYRIDVGPGGKRTSKAEQVRLIGNSVCPPVAEALVKANYVESIAEEIFMERAQAVSLGASL